MTDIYIYIYMYIQTQARCRIISAIIHNYALGIYAQLLFCIVTLYIIIPFIYSVTSASLKSLSKTTSIIKETKYVLSIITMVIVMIMVIMHWSNVIESSL